MKNNNDDDDDDEEKFKGWKKNNRWQSKRKTAKTGERKTNKSQKQIQVNVHSRNKEHPVQ